MRQSLRRFLLSISALVLFAVLTQPAVAQSPTASTALRAEITTVSVLGQPCVGEAVPTRVLAKNAGSEAWVPGETNLSYHWIDPSGDISVWDGVRTRLPHEVAPGESVDLILTATAPATAGAWTLQVDIVKEGVAWFSELGSPVSVTPVEIGEPRLIAPIRQDDFADAFIPFVRLTALLVGLVANVLLWRLWLERLAPRDSNADRALDVGVASLSTVVAVAQLLVFSVGLSLVRLLVGMALLHMAGWLVWRRTPVAMLSGPKTDRMPSLLTRALRGAGVAVSAALGLGWAFRALGKFSYPGVDVGYYHLSHALSYLQGQTPWGLLPSTQTFPMGQSVLASVLMLPTRSPLLFSAVNVIWLSLFTVAAGSILESVTQAHGLAWAPWITLALLLVPFVTNGLGFCADLPFAASTAAAFAVAWRIWRSRPVKRADIMLFGAAGGLAVACKTLGAITFASMVGLLAIGAAARWVRAGRPHLRLRECSWTLIGAVAVAMLLGGIWWLRNMVIGGMFVRGGLRGALSFLSGGDIKPSYASITRDLAQPGYRFAPDLLQSCRKWFGDGLLLLPLASVACLAIETVAAARRDNLQELRAAWLPRIELSVALVLLAGLHLLVFLQVPWSSLSWGPHGQSLRYLLAWGMLLGVVAAACAFFTRPARGPRGWPWPLLVYMVFAALLLSQKPLAPLARLGAALGRLGAPLLVLAGIGWALWSLAGRRPHLRAGLVVLGLAVVLLMANTGAQAQLRERARLQDRIAAYAALYEENGLVAAPLRSLRFAALDAQQACGTVDEAPAYWFDTYIHYSIELQGPDFDSRQFDLLPQSYDEAGVLGNPRPLAYVDDLPQRPCADFVVSAVADEPWSQRSEVEALLAADGLSLRLVAESPPFALLMVVPRD